MARDSKYGKIDIPGIPADEPVFVLRGQDICTPQVIRQYAECAEQNGSPAEHHESARNRADEIQTWQTENEGRVKSPD